MQLQAQDLARFRSMRPVLSGPSSVATAFLALSIAVSFLGCGSGTLSGGAQQGLQGLTTPVASAKGPQLGYLWLTTDRSLRPILGFPGASQIGQSVVPAGVYANAATSASADLAILQATDGSFDLMNLPSGAPVSLSLTLPVGATIRLSPSAQTALAYTPGATSASLITGLPSTPSVRSISAAAPISDSAISDTGTVVFESSQGSSTTVSVTPLSGHASTLSSIGSSGGLAFLPGRDDLLLADAGTNTLILYRDASNAPSTQVVPTTGLLNSPSSLGVSNSGRWAIIANRGSQTLVRVDLVALTATSVSCSCTPTMTAALADDGAFRVTDLADAPNWLIDATAATPRVLFIPSLPTATKTTTIASVVHP